MSKFTGSVKRKTASGEAQQRISEKIFYNSVMKDKKGNDIGFPEPGGKYYLYSKESNKKIGWVKMPSRPGEAGYGWCNLPAYLKMEEPPEVPVDFENEDWDEVDLDEYFDDELDEFEEERGDEYGDGISIEESLVITSESTSEAESND